MRCIQITKLGSFLVVGCTVQYHTRLTDCGPPLAATTTVCTKIARIARSWHYVSHGSISSCSALSTSSRDGARMDSSNSRRLPDSSSEETSTSFDDVGEVLP
jgi:hypothetical protein